MHSWTRPKSAYPTWPHLCMLLNLLQLVQGLGKHYLPLIEQDDWVLPGHLGAASSAVSRWPHSQDQQLVQGGIMTYRWLRASVNTSTAKGSLRKYGHIAQWDKGHGKDYSIKCLLLYALMPSRSLSLAAKCGFMKYCPR